MRIRSAVSLSLALASTPFLASCQDVDADDVEMSRHEAVASTNGIYGINGISAVNGISGVNGIQGVNGISAVNGISGVNGLSNTTGLITTSAGRDTIAYLVKCALPAGHSISKTYNGTTYSFAGSLGVGAGWEYGACDTNCQQMVSACVMAHINTTGRHIPIYLDSPNILGLGRSNKYPMQEGAFFGNIFVSPPQAYYCNGYDWDRGPVSGRIGANQSGSPYKNPFSGSGLCQNNCSTVGAVGEAFSNCSGYGNNVITVYRDFDPNVPYTICNPITNNCIAIKGNSTSAGGIVDVWPKNSASQKFYFERMNSNSHDGNYRIRSNNSGLYIDMTNGSTANGGTMLQQYGNGGTNQLWNMIQIEAGVYLIENEKSRLLLNAAGIAPGAPLVQSGNGGYDDFQIWKLALAQ